MKSTPKQITRITKTEFETNDGVIHPIPFELDEIPTLEEFQRIYDDWFQIFQQKGFIRNEETRANN